MHENPDQYGFGTIGLGKLIADNTKAFTRIADCMEDMDEVLRWIIRNDPNDSTLPPKIRKVRKGS